MNQFGTFVGLITMMITINVLIAPIRSQMEICHWDCVLVGCDYYGDCDYDCYEVCDIWRGEAGVVENKEQKIVDKNSDPNPDPRPKETSAHSSGNKKSVSMRIKAQNATGTVETNRQLAIWNQCASSTKSHGSRILGRQWTMDN